MGMPGDPLPPDADVVVALATPWGHAALAVVRLSGPGCHDVVARCCRLRRASSWQIGRPLRVDCVGAHGVFDDGVAVLGRAPHTFTGEDTAEITLHGNPVLVRMLLDAATAHGARLAEPGAFSRRALRHGKLDLVQAEGLLQVMAAKTARGAALARQGLDGRLGATFDGLRPGLLDAAAELEARLDYPDDELALRGDGAVCDDLTALAARCRTLAETHRVGHVLVHGAEVALVGAVNAGKSSLFNALLGRTRALVSPQPGTTRDVVSETTLVQGIPVTLLDTAGERATDDPIEAAGLALAQDLVANAHAVVVVLRARPDGGDDTERAILERTAHLPRVVVYNGIDRPGVAPAPDDALPVSAASGQGLDALKGALAERLMATPHEGSEATIASARQRDVLLEIGRCAEEAVAAMPVAGVAVAADAVMRALEAVDALTGADTREDVLDTLFSRFCIGK